jgi:hypothetical protein
MLVVYHGLPRAVVFCARSSVEFGPTILRSYDYHLAILSNETRNLVEAQLMPTKAP